MLLQDLDRVHRSSTPAVRASRGVRDCGLGALPWLACGVDDVRIRVVQERPIRLQLNVTASAPQKGSTNVG
jgi:hypothetical protein